MITVQNAVLERSTGGTPFSAEFHDIYHSEHGGLAQSRHVFLGGNALPERWQGQDAFTILETGFGLGLTFLCAWEAWRADPRRRSRRSRSSRPWRARWSVRGRRRSPASTGCTSTAAT